MSSRGIFDTAAPDLIEIAEAAWRVREALNLNLERVLRAGDPVLAKNLTDAINDLNEQLPASEDGPTWRADTRAINHQWNGEGAMPLTREDRVAEILRTRLGGVDRITVDDPGTPPYKRYAHILSNGLGTNLYTSDDRQTNDDAYVYEGSGWKSVGVIDLDTGDVVE